jgi:hypothetical protein
MAKTEQDRLAEWRGWRIEEERSALIRNLIEDDSICRNVCDSAPVVCSHQAWLHQELAKCGVADAAEQRRLARAYRSLAGDYRKLFERLEKLRAKRRPGSAPPTDQDQGED